MTGDRISEAYNGKLSKIMKENSQRRIDWFCDKVKGENVLDIGCSQGILPILLGRKNKNVIGIDNDINAINYALEEQKSEEQSVKEKVRFICDDFLTHDFEEKFDTVIMGEILEHLFNPQLFLKKASVLLKEDGVFLASVPFGINRYPDHKRTYYFYNFYNQINEFFKVQRVIFMGKWIAVIAYSKKSDISEQDGMEKDFLEEYENAVYFLEESWEKKLKQEQESFNEKIEQLNNFNGELNKEISYYKEQINAVKIEDAIKIENLQNSILEKEQKIKEIRSRLEKKIEELNIVNDETNKEVSSYKEQINVIKKEDAIKIENLQSRIFELQGRLEGTVNENMKLNEMFIDMNKLKKDNSIYKRKLNETKKNETNLKIKYSDLKNSKLGKIQVNYWKIKGRGKRKIVRIIFHLKKLVKKIPFVRKIVRNDRDTKEEKRDELKYVKQNTLLKEKKNLKMSEEKEIFEIFQRETDRGFFDGINNILNRIPISNGGRYYEKHNYTIGIIADEFLYAAFKDAANFIFITPDNWKSIVEKTDFLLIVSTWGGLNEEWRGAAQEGHDKRKLIYEIIKIYKDCKKMTAFYSKEDPPNYSVFLGIAMECDYIFTTCVEVVNKYKKDCGNDNVNVVCFGINPLYHNPIGFRNPYKRKGVIFSGSWMSKYSERIKDTYMLFSGVLESKIDLKIIDRNYTSEKYKYPKYMYPREYWKYISPAIEHNELQKVHKLYNWAINVNSVTDSMTMFANRGYELQAAGTLLISNYSVGMNNKLPMIYTITGKEEIGKIINSYSDEELYKHQIAGIRSVMTGETAYDRVGQILENVGLQKNNNLRKILVVVNKISQEIREVFNYQSYNNKELITIEEFSDRKLAECDMVTFFHEDMDYDLFYLEDMSNAFKYTDCDYITKDAVYDGDVLIQGKEHDYVNCMKNKYCTLFWSKNFTCEQLKAFHGTIELSNGYSIDHFNFNLKKMRIQKEENFKLSVIIPVYNNGKQLLGKAFTSLKRSTMFRSMEIILVDDGSTDEFTDKVVKYLNKNYSNVKMFLFGDGGSGSASRPRNKGIELASADYVTYLDPDNEAISDGYTKLYDISVKNNYDITVGNMLKLTTKIVDAKYYQKFVTQYGKDLVFEDSVNFMKMIEFSPMSIQAMVIKKSLILENNLLQPVGAAGEDSLFCWELFLKAKTIKALNVPIHIYYAEVEGSTINNVGKKFFEKYYLIEKPRRKLLEENGFLDLYMKQRFNKYYVNWTLEHLSKVKSEDYKECALIAYDIFKVYEDVYDKSDEIINKFIKKVEALKEEKD